MVTSSFILVLLLGTRVLPPEQRHFADAMIHIGFDLSVTTVSMHRSSVVTMQTTAPPLSTR